ncbi:MAG TPA: transcription initiation factor IIB [Thermoplasmatales archaeon]|nr:transcription initiation factor IIB [Thermoplasmatales archaeon]
MPENKRVKLEEITHCPECGSTRIPRDYKRGELVCTHCGLVIEDRYIDQGPEWQAFDQEERNKVARAGAPVKHPSDLPTVIDWKNTDSYGKSIPPRNRPGVYRLRKWQQRVGMRKKPLSKSSAMSLCDKIVSSMELPRRVREATAMLYQKAVKQGLIRGRNPEAVIAAVLYAACRQCNVPRTLDEIADSSGVDRKDIGRNYRFMSRQLELNLVPFQPQDYLFHFCHELQLGEDIELKALELLRLTEAQGLTNGRGPTGIAAAIIYITSFLAGETRTQSDVAAVAGVTEVTIRNRYKELVEQLGLDVSQQK